MLRALARLMLTVVMLVVGCRGDGGQGPTGGTWSWFEECGVTADFSKLAPVLTCVAIDGGSRVSVFGYRNDGSTTATVPAGPANRLVPSPDAASADGRLRPVTVLPPGFFRAAFTIRQSTSAPRTAWQLGSATTADDAATCPLSMVDGAVYAQLPPLGGAPGERVLIAPNETAGLAEAIVPTEATSDDQHGHGAIAERPSGSFAVAADGAATYSIRFHLPAGRAGMQPSLGLEYHSRAGNGLVGTGWSLSGISQISRCSSPRVGGVARDPVSFQFKDDLCLDGDPLIPAPGTPDPQLPTIVNTFHPEHDPFTRVLRTAAGFTVQRRDGRVQQYGGPGATLSTARTSVDISGAPEHGDGAQVTLSWFLRETADRNGNAVRYAYEDDGYIDRNCQTSNLPCSAAELRPREITYTHGPGTVATRRVEFIYEDRDDATLGWLQGFPMRVSKRLHEVRVTAPNPVTTSLVRRYRLEYDYGPVTERSRLARVFECDGGSVCKQPVELNYEDGDRYYDVVATDLVPSADQARDMYAFDANHDGLDDVVMRLRRSPEVHRISLWGKPHSVVYGEWEYRAAEMVGGKPRLGSPHAFKVVERLWADDIALPPGFGTVRPALFFQDGRPRFPLEFAQTSTSSSLHWATCVFAGTVVCDPPGTAAEVTGRDAASALDLLGSGRDTVFRFGGGTTVLGVQTSQTGAWSLLFAKATEPVFRIAPLWTAAPSGVVEDVAVSEVTALSKTETHTLLDFNGDGLTDAFVAEPGTAYPPRILAGLGAGAFRRLDVPSIPLEDWSWPRPDARGAAGTMVLDQKQTGSSSVLVYAGETAIAKGCGSIAAA